MTLVLFPYPARAQQSPIHHAFVNELTSELRDPAIAEKYHSALQFCREGQCALGHQLYRSIIADHPNQLAAIQCYLEVLGCYVAHGDLAGADSLRKELIEAGERVLQDHAGAEWTAAMCCLMACCAARIQDSDPRYESQALEYADKATRAAQAPTTDLSILWQRAEVYGLVHEKRGEWPDAIEAYEDVIPSLRPPQSWYFKILLARALERQTMAVSNSIAGVTNEPSGSITKATQLLDRARQVLQAVVSEAGESDSYGKLARRSLKDLAGEEGQLRVRP